MILHLGKLVNFFVTKRLLLLKSRNLVRLDPSGSYLEIQNPGRDQSVTPRDVLFEKFSQKCAAVT